ncbi:type IV pilus assembly protein PilM [Pleurocapsa sp. FMAR1]|uniref:type IV pilus assembly protein PilM n=1 Tax=Pleurocapsa sp. FMAR1 TaxID=3040204 RepID=UPI0029C7F41B|nr:type IV pilus assembly protein PilM [Pleurocapsa sp. FMAR1]
MLNTLTNIFAKNGDSVGIEINTQKINIAQIVKQGQQYKLMKNVSADIPEGVFEEGQIVDSLILSELIKDTLKANKISATKVFTAVPMREAIIRVIPVPAELDEAELKDMVMVHEAGMYLPYPREEVDLDYVKLGYFMDEDGIEKVNVLLVATKKEVTDLYTEVFEQAQLKLSVLEINSFALIRTIREQLRQFGSKEAVVLVDLEFDSTEIAIVVEGVPQFSRTVPIGTYQMYTAFSQAMSLPATGSAEMLYDIDILSSRDSTGVDSSQIESGKAALIKILGELSDELSRSINFYINQSEDLEIVQLLLAGPGAGIRQLDEFFTQKLNLPTIKVDPIATLGLDINEDIASDSRPGLGIVLGLGMRDL